MNSQLYCPDETRKALVRDSSPVNGIDFLEVLDAPDVPSDQRQRTLLVYFLKPLTGAALTVENLRLEGGVRVQDIAITGVTTGSGDQGNLLTVQVQQPGDFSTYTLRLVRDAQHDDPPVGFDPLLSTVLFSFKVALPSEFDCASTQVCPPATGTTPRIEYLAKDYASFRQLILDRLALNMPAWQERNPADVGIALVEILAYAADYLSYYQDAVATEAYLGTARRRVSVRRHARLVNYPMHDGASARVWAACEVATGSNADGALLPAGSLLLTGEAGSGATLPPSALDAALTAEPVAFQTLHPVTLRAARGAIPIYTWGDPRCCLPAGATSATLEGRAADLDLHAGDVLIFEEILGPASGKPEDADPTHQHAVRLSDPPQAGTDPANNKDIVQISWYADDGLPFPLCLWQVAGDVPGTSQPVSIARGNVVLADHGLSVSENLQVPPGLRRPYRPWLQQTDLAQAMPYDDEQARLQPAIAALSVDPRQVMPAISLVDTGGGSWFPRRDLLGPGSDQFAQEFVVEIESDGRAYLRFGDGILGQQPAAGTSFVASYRVGNGPTGNIGPQALTRLVTTLDGITRVWNPLPAGGGTDPESLDQVRLSAPQAFRTQERAVTEEDYAAAAQRYPGIQRAAATRRWTGSWYTMFVTVDRIGGLPVDAAFKDTLRAFMEQFRLAGHDLEIDGPRYVPLDIALTVYTQPDYVRSDVKEALLTTFSNRVLPDGTKGFFHPDNFTFGQPVFLSKIVATAMNVPGVAWVDTSTTSTTPARFQRWGEGPHGELESGRMLMGRLEIARLDNNPNAPENGKIEFSLLGGR